MPNHSPFALGAKASLALVSLAALVLSACAVGPNYHRPVVQTPSSFRGTRDPQQPELQTASFADEPWWQVTMMRNYSN